MAWLQVEGELPVNPLRDQGIPEPLIDLISKMTAKSRRDRYSDYLELLNDLDVVEKSIRS
jgi:hypothetical protein